MRERPIIFSGPMVRAILAGTKAQTRRVVKEPRWAVPGTLEADGSGLAACAKVSGCLADVTCPYGAPGDRLWVRETWAACRHGGQHRDCIEYRADDEYGPAAEAAGDAPRWTPSIHMPRWASRVTLEVTGVRVERLTDISPADAGREGLEPTSNDSVRGAFAKAWDALHGAGAWSANPWVWVVSFKRTEAGRAR